MSNINTITISGNSLTEELYVYFTQKILNNSINSNEIDKTYAKQLVEKTISNFVAKNAVSSIGTKSFYNCPNLEYVYVPGAYSAGDEAFSNCPNLSFLVLSSTDKEGVLGKNVFQDCPNLNVLILPGKYVSLSTDNVLCDADKIDDEVDGQTLFKKKLGRIYVNPDYINSYMVGWRKYAEIIKPIDELIYKEC